MSGSIQTLNQQRAEFALRCVARIKKLAEGRWVFLHGWEKGDFKYDKIREELELGNLRLSDVKRNKEKFGSFWEEIWNSWEEIKNSKKKDIREKSRKSGKNKEQIEEEINKAIEKLKEKAEKEGIKSVGIKTQINYASDYSSHAKRLPQLIVSNGLIPTLAFYKSKGKDRRQIYNDIELWLKFGANNGNGIIADKDKDLLEYLLEIDSSQLRLATMEALEFTSWLKRMAEIELKGGGE